MTNTTPYATPGWEPQIRRFLERKMLLVVAVSMLISVIAVLPAASQETAEQTALPGKKSAPKGGETEREGGDKAVSDVAGDPKPGDRRLEELEKKNGQLEQRLEAIEKTSDADTEEKEALRQQMEMIQEGALERMSEEERALKIYGFIDVQWYKFLLKKNIN